MNLFKEQIERGVNTGIAMSLTEICPGRGDPEERCPLNPKDGCACYYRAYREAPFWRRWRMDKPKIPESKICLNEMLSIKMKSMKYDKKPD